VEENLQWLRISRHDDKLRKTPVQRLGGWQVKTPTGVTLVAVHVWCPQR
jgi:hypothetical protein